MANRMAANPAAVFGLKDRGVIEQGYYADLVLLDNGYGTGRTFDWSLAGGVNRPFLLAGGLAPDNIPEAVAALHPYGVDISSGVETGGQKDRGKILAAVSAARRNET